MKRIILSLLSVTFALLMTGDLKAQQDPYTTHYAFNRLAYNPAVAGSLKRFCVTALSHYQYLGYEDRTLEFYPDPNNPNSIPPAEKNVGPKTQMFTFSAPITQYGGIGIGFINDKLGYENATHVKLDAAGIIPLRSGARLSLGFEMNMLQKGLNGAKLKPLAPNDPNIPTLPVSDRHNVFGAGVYYIDPMLNSVSTRNLWVSASVLNLNSPEFVFGGGTVFHTPVKHIYVSGGIDMLDFMGKPDLIFHPSVMFKYNTVFQADMTALVEYQRKLWGGVAYRTTADAFSIMLGYSGFRGPLAGLRIGYSYDLNMTKVFTVSTGTHEIQLNYCFEIVIPPTPKINIITPPFMHRDSD